MPTDELPSMTLVGHLSELRSRIIKALAGLLAAYAVSLTFTDPLWKFVCRPAAQALEAAGYPPILYLIDPMDAFNIIWFKLPVVVAMFLAAPWVLYQAWAFVAPGLYRNERRWAAPFVICSAGLFIAGGTFAYFVLFRYGLTFLLSIGHQQGAGAMVSMERYFGLFVDVVLGAGVMFEVPMVIFLLTAIGLVTPGLLVRNSRYAVLAIFVLAAVITPTSDVVNLTLLAGPMCALFALGVFASWLYTLRRDGLPFPRRIAALTAGGIGAGTAGYLAWRLVDRRRRNS
jgi:sec-independent protein translocase protein TatC